MKHSILDFLQIQNKHRRDKVYKKSKKLPVATSKYRLNDGPVRTDSYSFILTRSVVLDGINI
jgi:hypothetical protein